MTYINQILKSNGWSAIKMKKSDKLAIWSFSILFFKLFLNFDRVFSGKGIPWFADSNPVNLIFGTISFLCFFYLLLVYPFLKFFDEEEK